VKKIFSRIAASLPCDDWLVIGWSLVLKALLLALGAASFQSFEGEDVPLGRSWLEIWNQWDAEHFVRIAEFGYSAADEFKAWFYPLYPWSVRILSYLTVGDYLIASFVVSGIALLFVVVLLRRIADLEWNEAIARRAVYFFLIFPAAYVLHIGYTESLFLAFAVASVYAARKERWWLAGTLGALAWMTRANGIVLLPTLAVEAGHQWWITKRWRWQWLWIAIVPAGFAVYLLLNWQVSRDPFAFLKLRKELFHMSFSWPWIGIRDAFLNVRRLPMEGEMVGTQEAFFTVLGLICAIGSWSRLRPVYAMWVTGNWILFSCVTFIEGMPRYVLTMFPIFFLFAFVGTNRFWNSLITIWSLLLLALFSGLFVRGSWVF
jgi:hypothetical protein